MTLREALTQRIPRVRKPHWANPDAYLRLPLRSDGTGPWAELYDDVTQRDVLGVRPGSQRIALLADALDDDGYEAYTGPISDDERHRDNFASAYTES